jgi:hypothetical protein
MTRAESLRANPIPWLLEDENPAVRYWTLVDLLDRPADDPEVQAARAAIPAYAPIAGLLAAQKPDGYWIKRDYYLPKHEGTFWVLSMLADAGLTSEDEPIRRACEFMFTFQLDDGAFHRRSRMAGEGLVWRDAGPCTHARIVRFLIQFGYGDDPRLRTAVDWLLMTQLDDGMWDHTSSRRYGCLRATLDVLRVATLEPRAVAHPGIARGAKAVRDLLMEPRMHRYHVGIPWTTLEYPYCDYGLIPALDALLQLGYGEDDPKIAQGLEYLLSRQLPDGAWPLDLRPDRLPFDVGQPGAPNKWLTLDALRVVKTVASRGAQP